MKETQIISAYTFQFLVVLHVFIAISSIIAPSLTSAGGLKSALFELSLSPEQVKYRETSAQVKADYKTWKNSDESKERYQQYLDKEFSDNLKRWNYFNQNIPLNSKLIKGIKYRGLDKDDGFIIPEWLDQFSFYQIERTYKDFYMECFTYNALKDSDLVLRKFNVLNESSYKFTTPEKRKDMAKKVGFDYKDIDESCNSSIKHHFVKAGRKDQLLDIFKKVNSLEYQIAVSKGEISREDGYYELTDEQESLVKESIESKKAFEEVHQSANKQLADLKLGKSNADQLGIERNKAQYQQSQRSYIVALSIKGELAEAIKPEKASKFYKKCLPDYEQPISGEVGKAESKYMCACIASIVEPETMFATFFKKFLSVSPSNIQFHGKTNYTQAYANAATLCGAKIDEIKIGVGGL